jgi:rifampicin phosphotransferase
MDMPVFTAPGPGPWEIETAHFPRPFPKFGLDGIIRAFKKGFAEGTANYGILLSHFEVEIVNGFWYQQPAAFGAPKGAAGPPPNPILWLLTRLHPGMRKRIRAGGDAFSGKRWRQDLDAWDIVDKPAAMARHQELLAKDPAKMSDGELVAHLRECEAHVEAMVYLHHKYTIASAAPTGDLIAQTTAWTGKEVGEVLGLLRGSSRISLGFSADELQAVAEAIRADPVAKTLLESGDQARGTLDSLLAHEGPVADATKSFVDIVKHRALSYEIGECAAGELPGTLVKGIRAAVDGRFESGKDDKKAVEETIRAAVPEAHRAAFDDLLVEARMVNRLRDERGMYADCWAVGIARRALLEAGRRLTESGKLHAPAHAVDLTMSEHEALFAGKDGPSADAIQERVVWRTTKTAADCPKFLGGEPGGPPDVSILPEAARRPARAVEAIIGNLFTECNKTSTKTVVRGLSVNTGVYEGVARRIDGPSQFDRLQQGDVLITRSTAPYFNVVLPLLGAIVTDRGGQLCHAAIVAREYGIPGIVGTKEATKLIPDGSRVRVDGGSGEITILSA